MNRALVELIRYRLIEPLRWPETIFWIFVFPALLALALGIAFREQRPDPTSIAIIADQGADKLASMLGADPLLRVTVMSRDEADRALRTGKVVLQIVPGSPIRYRVDPTRPESHLARLLTDNTLQRGHGRTEPVPTVLEEVRSRGGRYIDFLIPGLLGLNLMSGGLWGLGWAITEARTRKLLRRFLATPMRRRDFLLAHMLARVAFVPLEAVTLLLFGWLMFDVACAGSLIALTFLILLGALSFAGLGTLLASRTRTLETMSGLINLCTMPMMLLSGVFFSPSRFPEMVQPLIRVLPLTALNDALRAVMNEGAPLLSLWPQVLTLVVWGAVSFFLGVRLFRWT